MSIGAGAGAALGGIGSGLFGFLGSSNAADAQQKALQQQIAFQQAVLQGESAQLAPWYNAGTAGLNQLATYLGLPGSNNASAMGTPSWGALMETPQQFSNNFLGVPLASGPTPYQMPQVTLQQFQSSPGYQWQLQQGVNAIQNAAGPTQGVLSGNTLQALQKYGTGLANQDWWNYVTNQQNQYNNQYNANNQNYWNQVQTAAGTQANIYNRLLGLQAQGQQAATLTGPQASVTNQIGNAFGNIGSAQAAGILGQYGALGSGFNSLVNPFANPGSYGMTGGGNLGSLFSSLFNNQNSGGVANATVGYGGYGGGGGTSGLGIQDGNIVIQ